MLLKTIFFNKAARKVVALAMAVFVGFPGCGNAKTTAAGGTTTTTVTVKTALSQTKVLKATDGQIVMQIDIAAPDTNKEMVHKPTDFVVVLDRSGSMSSDNKMKYALKAIESLIDQMKEDDRFALVTFDSIVETPITLTRLSESRKRSVIDTVRSLTPRGSTFLSGGLEKGIDLVLAAKKSSGSDANHAQRLIMLSDGEANVGITDISSLNIIAKKAVRNEFVLTTIGVGIDFNENLLSSLADYGAGNYHYLKELALLDKVLADEFYAASRVFARNLVIDFDLGSGMRIIDVSGYPIQQSGRHVTVEPGVIYAGQSRRLYATISVPTETEYTESLGSVQMSFTVAEDGSVYKTPIWKDDEKVSCVGEDRKEEVKASVNREVYDNAWTANNYGTFLKDNASSIKNGDSGGAKTKIQAFKKKLAAAYDQSPSPTLKQKLDEVNAVEKETDDAFSGADKEEKQKALSKGYQSSGTTKQRTK